MPPQVKHADRKRKLKQHDMDLLTVSLPELLHDGSDQAFRSTVFGMVLTLNQFQSCREAFGRAMGLTGSQFAVLVGIAHSEGDHGVSIRILADHVRMASTHVTTEVGRLLRRKLLLKRPNPGDGRSVLVSLSRRGKKIVNSVTPFMRAVNNELFSGFSRKEIEVLDQLMKHFAQNGERAMKVIQAAKAQRK
jgi:DNA-binding MarR family transcriptional regulator